MHLISFEDSCNFHVARAIWCLLLLFKPVLNSHSFGLLACLRLFHPDWTSEGNFSIYFRYVTFALKLYSPNSVLGDLQGNNWSQDSCTAFLMAWRVTDSLRRETNPGPWHTIRKMLPKASHLIIWRFDLIYNHDEPYHKTKVNHWWNSFCNWVWSLMLRQ